MFLNLVVIVVIVFAVSAASIMLNSQNDESDFSMLNINTFMQCIGTGDGLIAETEMAIVCF